MKSKSEKLKELLSLCKKVTESDLKFIIGYASGIAIKSEEVKKNG